MPSRFILNEFNLNLASARLLVRFWFLVIFVILACTVVGILIVNELIRRWRMSGRVSAFSRVVLHGWDRRGLRRLILRIGRIRRVWINWRDV